MHQYRFFAKIKLKISMNFEDGFNQKVWSVLHKIKKYYIPKNNDLPIQYEIRLNPLTNNYLSSFEECNILKELAKYEAIKIYQRKILNCFCILVILEVKQPKFNQIYNEYALSKPFYAHQKHQKSFENEENIENEEFLNNLDNQQNLCFPTYYLRQEYKRLDIVIRHFLKAGAIGYKDYRYLVIFNKMIRKMIFEAVNNQKDINENIRYPKYNLKHNYKGKKFRKSTSTSKIITKETENINKETVKEKQPVPITGKIEVSGLNESLKALRAKELITTEPKFPYKIPAGTHWNNVIIKFIDNENVEIHVKKLKHTTNYKEMGMIGKGKIPEPSEQWLFMKVLAQCNGEIAIKDPEAKDKYKKQKQALTEILRNYFSIDYDPFYPYKSCLEKGGNSYKIKIMLIPPVVEKNIRPIITDEETDPLGIQEYLNNQMVNR
jgi:hypothetical protein